MPSSLTVRRLPCEPYHVSKGAASVSSRRAYLDAKLPLGYGRQAPMQGDVMEARSMKVAKWTDWFNLLERRGKCGMATGLIPQQAQNGVIGFMSRRKGRLDMGAD